MKNKKWNLEEDKNTPDIWINAIFGAIGMVGLFVLVVFILAGFQG